MGGLSQFINYCDTSELIFLDTRLWFAVIRTSVMDEGSIKAINQEMIYSCYSGAVFK
jgi:hypothetical protein